MNPAEKDEYEDAVIEAGKERIHQEAALTRRTFQQIVANRVRAERRRRLAGL